MSTNKLTDLACRKALGRSAPYKLTDGEGLYLHVKPNGTRSWLFYYRVSTNASDKKMVQKTISLGVYPEVTLQRARELREKMRLWVRDGKDPSVEREIERLAERDRQHMTLDRLHDEYFDHYAQGRKPSTVENAKCYYRYVKDSLGGLPITSITPNIARKALKEIEARGILETTKRCRLLLSNMFDYAISHDYAQGNPITTIAGSLKPPVSNSHPAAKSSQMPEFFDALHRATNVMPLTKILIVLYVHSIMRVNAMAAMKWAYFDWDNRHIEIPASAMKGTLLSESDRDGHIIPLNDCTIALWKDLQRMTGHSEWCFPSYGSTGHYTAQVPNQVIRRLGFDFTAHGMRSTASTTLAAARLFSPDAIELQLSHLLPGTKSRRIYNRFDYLDERRELMEFWSQKIIEWQKIG